MKYSALIDAVRLAYPQIWFACHVEHRTRGQNRGTGLTDREVGILAHVNAENTAGCRAASLAHHLGIGKSDLSQHLKRMKSLDLIRTSVDPQDGRQRLVALTAAGRQAVADASPLDGQRLERLLALIPARERAQSVRGLQILADAARRLRTEDKEGVK
jgi:DNA-binding MarR family transcriptional regulator